MLIDPADRMTWLARLSELEARGHTTVAVPIADLRAILTDHADMDRRLVELGASSPPAVSSPA